MIVHTFDDVMSQQPTRFAARVPKVPAILCPLDGGKICWCRKLRFPKEALQAASSQAKILRSPGCHVTQRPGVYIPQWSSNGRSAVSDIFETEIQIPRIDQFQKLPNTFFIISKNFRNFQHCSSFSCLHSVPQQTASAPPGAEQDSGACPAVVPGDSGVHYGEP